MVNQQFDKKAKLSTADEVCKTLDFVGMTLLVLLIVPRYTLGWDLPTDLQLVVPFMAGWTLGGLLEDLAVLVLFLMYKWECDKTNCLIHWGRSTCTMDSTTCVLLELHTNFHIKNLSARWEMYISIRLPDFEIIDVLVKIEARGLATSLACIKQMCWSAHLVIEVHAYIWINWVDSQIRHSLLYLHGR